MTRATAVGARSNPVEHLAVFGGRPAFAEPRPIGQLFTPDVERFLALARPAVEQGRLSNGALVLRLEQQLAEFHGVRHCVAVANAAFGLTMLLQRFGRGRPGEVILPAFSYRGLPHFARIAGQSPRFCDVEERTHGLDPRAVERALGPQTSAILAVCNYNSPGDIDGLCAVARAAHVPILFDSVYAVGASYRGRRLGAFGAAEVYSLHATKLLNGFEGGYVTTDDGNLAAVLRWQRDESADAPPADAVLGTNARLGELHAAMALLSLESFDAIVSGNRRRFAAYAAMCARLPGLRLVPVEAGSNCSMAVVDVSSPWPLTRDEMVTVLRAEGAAIAAYYSPPLHRSVHCPPGYDVQVLPVAERLAARFLQLPVGELVSLDDIARLGDVLDLVARRGDAVAARLRRP